MEKFGYRHRVVAALLPVVFAISGAGLTEAAAPRSRAPRPLSLKSVVIAGDVRFAPIEEDGVIVKRRMGESIGAWTVDAIEPSRGTLAAAVEPVIRHLKAEHRMGRNHLKGYDGDAINFVLAVAGYNFSLLLRSLARLLRALFRALSKLPTVPSLLAKNVEYA